MVFDHLIFCCFPPLQPLALNTFRLRRSGASKGQIVQHAHIFFPRHTHTELFLPIHMLFHPTQMFFPNYPIDWIRATIYGA